MIAGRFRHRDNKGHEGVLGAGGGQWMTAGRGIIHSEMPEQEEGLVWGFQLWLNLAAAEKMQPAAYRDLQPRDIPTATLPGGAAARVVAGRVAGVVGPKRARSAPSRAASSRSSAKASTCGCAPTAKRRGRWWSQADP